MTVTVTLLLTLLAILVVAYVCIYLIKEVGLPHPIDMLAKGIVVLVAIIAIVSKSGIGF